MRKPIVIRHLLFFFILLTSLQLSAQKPISADAFLENPFVHEANHSSLLKKYRWFSGQTYETIKNRHKKSQTDTIFITKISKSTFEFYKSRYKEIFFKADIVNRRIKLKNGIRVGMKKEKLLTRLNGMKTSKKDPSKITITDHDKLSKCTFHFNANKLSRIEFIYYLD